PGGGVGPLGLAIERLEQLRRLPDQALTPVIGAPGLAGGVVTPAEMLLALAPDHLAQLRQAAVSRGADRRSRPPALAWSAVGTRPGLARPRDHAFRRLEALLVLDERLPGETTRCLALPLRAVRSVVRAGTLRPGPPGAAPVAGYHVWGRHVVPAVEL